MVPQLVFIEDEVERLGKQDNVLVKGEENDLKRSISINYLDVPIEKIDSKFEFSVYKKPTAMIK